MEFNKRMNLLEPKCLKTQSGSRNITQWFTKKNAQASSSNTTNTAPCSASSASRRLSKQASNNKIVSMDYVKTCRQKHQNPLREKNAELTTPTYPRYAASHRP
jgi:hypothetical protein